MGSRTSTSTASGSKLLFDPEEDRESNRFNDGKVDRVGRLFWPGPWTIEEREATRRASTGSTSGLPAPGSTTASG